MQTIFKIQTISMRRLKTCHLCCCCKHPVICIVNFYTTKSMWVIVMTLFTFSLHDLFVQLFFLLQGDWEQSKPSTRLVCPVIISLARKLGTVKGLGGRSRQNGLPKVDVLDHTSAEIMKFNLKINVLYNVSLTKYHPLCTLSHRSITAQISSSKCPSVCNVLRHPLCVCLLASSGYLQSIGMQRFGKGKLLIWKPIVFFQYYYF